MTTVLYCITTHFINNIIFTAVLVSFYRVITTSFVRTTRKILSFHVLFCLFSLKILNFFVSKQSNFAYVHAFFQFFINSDTYMYTHFSTTYKSAHCRITHNPCMVLLVLFWQFLNVTSWLCLGSLLFRLNEVIFRSMGVSAPLIITDSL